MGVEGFSHAAAEEGKRSHKRARVLLAAKLRRGGGEIDVRLRDLSRKGALIESSVPLRAGEEVVFTRGSTTVAARIAWAHGERQGLEFLDMIEESEVLIHITRKPIRPAEKFRRPRILGEDMTEHERRLARIWSRTVGIAVSADGD